MNRECGNCTACCEGWLSGVVHGHVMKPGQMCHFLGSNRCADYENRPQHPCINFECVWLKNKELPEWFHPLLCKAIIVEKDWSGGKYWSVTECGVKLDSSVLSWLVQYSLEKMMPIMYQINRSRYLIGPPEFHEEFRKVT